MALLLIYLIFRPAQKLENNFLIIWKLLPNIYLISPDKPPEADDHQRHYAGNAKFFGIHAEFPFKHLESKK